MTTSYKFKITFLVALSIFLLTAGFGCKGTSQEVKQATQPITLEYWRVEDSEDALTEILAAYRQLRPFVTINYRKIRAEEYEQQLLDAWAEGRGPDMFSLPNTWIQKYGSKIFPLPAKLTVPYTKITGTFKKEQKTVMRPETSLTIGQIKKLFVDQVERDVVVGNQVVALPLALDTMALYSNRDLLNSSGIAEPPRTWDGFREAVIKLTKQDAADNIIQAGASLGTANNIEYPEDILAVIMMQLGAQMEDKNSKQAAFDRPLASNNERLPGVEALRFYADFANPAKLTYTWNDKQGKALTSFLQGKTAFWLGYAYDLPFILTQAPQLNLEISPLPQLDSANPVNISRYWVETVFANPNPDRLKQTMAWDFLQFAARADQAKTYLKRAKRPTALRSLVEEQKQDIDLGIFAGQILTAKGWYHGKNPVVASQTFRDMINQALTGQETYEKIVQMGAARVRETY